MLDRLERRSFSTDAVGEHWGRKHSGAGWFWRRLRLSGARAASRRAVSGEARRARRDAGAAAGGCGAGCAEPRRESPARPSQVRAPDRPAGRPDRSGTQFAPKSFPFGCASVGEMTHAECRHATSPGFRPGIRRHGHCRAGRPARRAPGHSGKSPGARTRTLSADGGAWNTSRRKRRPPSPGSTAWSLSTRCSASSRRAATPSASAAAPPATHAVRATCWRRR